MTALAFDPRRDVHLDLLDVHLLPLVRRTRATPEELLERADAIEKLAGVGLDVELLQRWCWSAQSRYLVDLVAGRYGLTDHGRAKADQTRNFAKSIVARVPGWAKATVGGGTAGGTAGGAAAGKAGALPVALAAIKLIILAPLGWGIATSAALLFHAHRFTRSRTVVEGTVLKERFVREFPD